MRCMQMDTPSARSHLTPMHTTVTAGTPLRGVVSKDPKVGHTIHCQVLGQEEIKVGKKRWYVKASLLKINVEFSFSSQ